MEHINWNFVIISIRKWKKSNEFYFDLPDKMLFFTGQFILSRNLLIFFCRKPRRGKMSVPENKLRLVFIGKTGTGKSKTGNSILGIEAFKSKLGGASVTKKCSYEKNFNYGREISIVDTPGLFDTGEPSVMR